MQIKYEEKGREFESHKTKKHWLRPKQVSFGQAMLSAALNDVAQNSREADESIDLLRP